MASAVEICNLALSHLGVGKEIANLTTERSEESAACRRFYESARDAVLRDYPWPFTTKISALGLVAADPNDEWGFSYRYPTDALKLRRIPSGIRNDNRQSRVPFKLAQDSSGLIIYTDAENAQIEYTARSEDPGLYPADFVMALSFRLAVYIAPRVTGGDPFKMGDRARTMYQYELQMAQGNATNEEQAEEVPDAELIRARE